MSYDFTPFKKQLGVAEEWLKKEFSQIRTGQASPAILDNVKVESYGAITGLKEIASVTIEGARTLRISPWDKSQNKEIEKALIASNLGLSIVVDDQGVRAIFPDLTGDRRKEIAKLAKDKVEEAKKLVRSHREVIIKDLTEKEKSGGYGKDEIFRLKGEVQKMVDEANKKLEEAFVKKEKEVLS